MNELQFKIINTTKDSILLNQLLDDLLNNRIVGVCISDFYTQQECDVIVERSFAHGFYWFEENIRGRIGANLAQFQNIEQGKQRYFHTVTQYKPLRDWIFYDTGDPTNEIMGLFQSVSSPSLGYDREYDQNYSSGMIHIQQNATQLHVDRIWDEAPDWSISKVSKQFSSVLYLQTPEQGGEVDIYNREWKSEDLLYNRADTATKRRGVTLDLVEGVDKLSFTPQQGDLLLFSSELYHQIRPSCGDTLRISAMCFFGADVDGKLQFFI